MYIKYQEKQINTKICNNFFNRLIGFMGKKEITSSIIFPRCDSIHTMFMKCNIDVIMCDKNYNILYYYNNLPKNKFILPKKNVYYIIELPVNYFNIKINEKISLIKD